MKRSQLKQLIKEITKTVLDEDMNDASKDIERAKQHIEDKLRDDQSLSPEESSLALSSTTDSTLKDKLAQDMSSDKLTESSDDKLMTKDLLTKLGKQTNDVYKYKLIWQWVLEKHITFKQFCLILHYSKNGE